MLDTKAAGLVTLAIGHLDGSKPLPPEQLSSVLAGLQGVLNEHNIARLRMSEAQQKRRANAETAGARGPSVAYIVALEPAWRTQVLGAEAAHALVVETLQDLGVRGAAPKQGTIAVALSRLGEWTRLVDTDAGQQTLLVRRADGARVKAAKLDDGQVLIFPKGSLGGKYVRRDGPEHLAHLEAQSPAPTKRRKSPKG